ncbi:expressed protein [Echinococcus multilocularis]|uniref:Expressed protein n=1 Tax=Echinococcus multilocularis TaxID=6211 RepID=A0A068XVB6_ECHMU|nr:expressed protein [Echinococcus multilocularis]
MRVVIKMTPFGEEYRGHSKSPEAHRRQRSSSRSQSSQSHRQRYEKARSTSRPKSKERYQRLNAKSSNSRAKSRRHPESRSSYSYHFAPIKGYTSSSSLSSRSSISTVPENFRIIQRRRSHSNARGFLSQARQHSGKDTHRGRQCPTVVLELEEAQQSRKPRQPREKKRRSQAPRHNSATQYPNSEFYMITEVDNRGTSHERRETRSTAHKRRN